jgi:hypothetical protein
LQKNNLGCSDLSSSNIFFDVKTGNFKIYDLELFKGQSNCLKQASLYLQNPLEASTHCRFHLISPEFVQLVHLKRIQNIPVSATWKNDIFTLGMIALEAASLKPGY